MVTKLKSITKSRLAVVLSVLILLAGGGFAVWKHFAPSLDRYNAVIAAMANHTIQGEPDGKIDLSKTFPGVTPRDWAYIRWREDGSFAAMFPVYYGEGAQMSALVYTSRPLRDGDTFKRDSDIHFAQQMISVGTYDYLVMDKKINDHWYEVSYHMH